MIAGAANTTDTVIPRSPPAKTKAGERVFGVLFVDARPKRPQGMETASCRRCHTPYTFWNHYQSETDLQCINCGHYLATWIPT